MNENVVHFDIYLEFCKTVRGDIKYSEEHSEEFNDLYCFSYLVACGKCDKDSIYFFVEQVVNSKIFGEPRYVIDRIISFFSKHKMYQELAFAMQFAHEHGLDTINEQEDYLL